MQEYARPLMENVQQMVEHILEREMSQTQEGPATPGDQTTNASKWGIKMQNFIQNKTIK